MTSSSVPLLLLAGAARSVVDILQTLGGATLATTTIVLGAAMFDNPDDQGSNGSQKSGENQNESSLLHQSQFCMIIMTTVALSHQ